MYGRLNKLSPSLPFLSLSLSLYNSVSFSFIFPVFNSYILHLQLFFFVLPVSDYNFVLYFLSVLVSVSLACLVSVFYSPSLALPPCLSVHVLNIPFLQ